MEGRKDIYIWGWGGTRLCINPVEKKAQVHVEGSVPPSTWGSNHLNPIALIISTWPPTLTLTQNYNIPSISPFTIQFPIPT